jgi:Domain of unknown function (DUF4863)
MNKRDELIRRCIPFLDEIKDMTPSAKVEQWLNSTYGPGTSLYDDLARLIKAGIEEGWAANVEIDGPRYRRSRIAEPTAETFNFSITAVYMNSMDGAQADPEQTFRGDYHAHPYGEMNMVVPLNAGAKLAGPNGWCGAGWTVPAPGSHHYPEVKGGSLIALFFLPAGRISYSIKPPVESAALL